MSYCKLMLIVMFITGYINDVAARSYFLPDYQVENSFGSRGKGHSGQTPSTPSCSSYRNYYSTPQSGMKCEAGLVPLAPGLRCYYCEGCSSEYQYTEDNCRGDYTPSGGKCGGKSAQCICNPSVFATTASGSGCPAGKKTDLSSSCKGPSDTETMYKCIDDPCSAFTKKNRCEADGGYCVAPSNSECSAAYCDTCLDVCAYNKQVLGAVDNCDEGCMPGQEVDAIKCPGLCKAGGCKLKTCPDGQKLSGSSCVNMTCREAAEAYGYTPVETADELQPAFDEALPVVLLNDVETTDYILFKQNFYSPEALYNFDNQKFIGCKGMPTPLLTAEYIGTSGDISVYPKIKASDGTSMLANNLKFYGDVEIDWDSTKDNGRYTVDCYGSLVKLVTDFYGLASLNLHNPDKTYKISSLPYIVNLDENVKMSAMYAGCSGKETIINMKPGSVFDNEICRYTAGKQTQLVFKTEDGDDCGYFPLVFNCPDDQNQYQCSGQVSRQCVTCNELLSKRYPSSYYLRVSTLDELKTAMAAKKPIVLMNDLDVKGTVVTGTIYSPKYLTQGIDLQGEICGGADYTLIDNNLDLNNAKVYANVAATNALTLSGTNYLYGVVDFDYAQSSGTNPITYLNGDVVADNGGFWGYDGTIYINGGFPESDIADFKGGKIYVNNPKLSLDNPHCQSDRCEWILKKGVTLKVDDYNYSITATQDNTTIYSNESYTVPAICPDSGTYGPKCTGAMISNCGAGIPACIDDGYKCGECGSRCSDTYSLVATATELQNALKRDEDIYLTNDISIGSMTMYNMRDWNYIHSASEVCSDEYPEKASLTVGTLNLGQAYLYLSLPATITNITSNGSLDLEWKMRVVGDNTVTISTFETIGQDPFPHLFAENGAKVTIRNLVSKNDSTIDAMYINYDIEATNNADVAIEECSISSSLGGELYISVKANQNSQVRLGGVCYKHKGEIYQDSTSRVY